jgi:DinB superfamily
MKFRLMFLVAVAGSSALFAQSANVFSDAVRQNYNNVKRDIMRGAEKMPDANYAFKPAPESRTFGQVVVHIAAVQGALCVFASNGKEMKYDETKTTKAEALAMLKGAFEYCDPFYAALTDANGRDMGKMFGRDNAKFNILNFGVIHDNEMYGTMAAYLRANGLVPPSSETRGPAKK